VVESFERLVEAIGGACTVDHSSALVKPLPVVRRQASREIDEVLSDRHQPSNRRLVGSGARARSGYPILYLVQDGALKNCELFDGVAPPEESTPTRRREVLRGRGDGQARTCTEHSIAGVLAIEARARLHPLVSKDL
jgi:hypothetical protein